MCELRFPLLAQMFGFEVDQATLIPQLNRSWVGAGNRFDGIAGCKAFRR